MFGKRSVVVGLVVLNLVLAAAVLLSAFSPPRAFAQRMGLSEEYIAVTARADKNYDILYLIDLADRRLHCFQPLQDRSGKIVYGAFRDLAKDFGS